MSERYQVIIQPEAEQGIKNGYYWVSNYSPRQARQWLQGIYKAVMSLEMMPRRCSLAFENNFFEEEIRQLLYGKGKNTYRILFTVLDTKVQVIHIRHAAQEPLTPDESSD